ncbi:trichohyalin isoform X1 [Drosophila teissieri]|uniref:trichohyalin isoform X1 n=1 Tax=Drosophila teissieri TaxID=7243 RepID=UPI001CBA4DFF|nr:trichohyalin isoform X1 [Drosophila teissieri]
MMSTSTKIDRETSTRLRLDKMEQPMDARQQQRHRRRLGRSHREQTPVTGANQLQDDASPDAPPDPSPQMVRMQIRPPGTLSAHESKILRKRDKSFASSSARSQSQPREAEKLSSPDANHLIKHRSLSSPRHKEESSESELTTGSSSQQQRPIPNLGQTHDTLSRLEQNLQRFEDERRRFESEKRLFEREKREHKMRHRQQLDNEERKRLLQSYRKLSDRIQLPQDEEERRRLIHSLRLQRQEAPKTRGRNRSSGYEESSTQFSSSDADAAEETQPRPRAPKIPQGFVAAPIRGAPPPPPSVSPAPKPKPPERLSVSRNNSLSPVRPQRRSKTPEQREEILRKHEYLEVGESRSEVIKPRISEAEQQSELMQKYMEAAERAAKAEAALAEQILTAEGVRRSHSLRLADKEEKPQKRSSSLERPLRPKRSGSLERKEQAPQDLPKETTADEPDTAPKSLADPSRLPEELIPEAKPKVTLWQRLKNMFRRKKKIQAKGDDITDLSTELQPEKLASRSLLYHLSLEARHEWKRLKLDYPQKVEELRQLRNRCVAYLICMAMLLGFGGLLFRYTEGAAENIYKCEVRKVKRDFIDRLWDVSHNMREEDWKSLARQKLRSFEDELNNLAELGLRRYPGQKSWNFVNCFIFCWTVITTIGYGHITPKTGMGRSLTIVYAIIGIPMFLIVLADLGKLFTRCVKFLWVYVRRMYYTRSCRRIRKQQQIRSAMTGFNTMYDMAIRRPSMFFGNSGADNDEESQADAEAGRSVGTSHPETPTSPYPETFEVDDEFNLPVSVASLLLITYILLGSFGFLIMEPSWTPLDAFYYVFISMSTIGFGDLVPGNPFYVMVSMIYLMFGLALTSMFINVVQIKLSDHFKMASAKVGATIGMNMASELGDEGGSQVKTPSELASVHGSRLDRIEEDGLEANGNGHSPVPPLTSILRAPRPLSPVSNGVDANGVGGDAGGDGDVSPPPLLPRRQVSVDPQPPAEGENKKKKKHRFF